VSPLVRVFVLSRHGQSTLNAAALVNGDPRVPGPLTTAGRAAAALLGSQLAHLPLDLCVHTRFERTAETAAVALAGRAVPVETEPLLDDVDVGELDGRTIEEYRAWKAGHARGEPFPGGESLDAAALRYAHGFRALLARPAACVLVVCHEIPVRYALNGAAGSDELDGPAHLIANATPYLFDEAALDRAAVRIESLVRAEGPVRDGGE
jgi:broad specificity phosphatase PhoE